jgi:RNA polymerase sporulation-specific sigma factor
MTQPMAAPPTRLIRILARKFSGSAIPEEDLVQEGMLAYIRASQTFNPDAGVKFETYASRVITNRFIDLLRKTHDTSELIESNIEGNFSMDDQVSLLEIKKILASRVNELERAIFNSYIEGFSYDEIGKIFTLPRKKIDNTVQKVKRIIKSQI